MRDDSNRAIAKEAKREIGDDISRGAHWFHGEEYNNIPAYNILSELGDHLKDHGYVDMGTVRDKVVQNADKD